MVIDYIEAISLLDYDHRHKCNYANKIGKPHKIDYLDKVEPINGVIFSSKSISTSLYDKQKECQDPGAKGILRHEVRILGKKHISKCTGYSEPKLKDLTKGIAEKVLEIDLARLGMDRPIYSKSNALDQ